MVRPERAIQTFPSRSELLHAHPQCNAIGAAQQSVSCLFMFVAIYESINCGWSRFYLGTGGNQVHRVSWWNYDSKRATPGAEVYMVWKELAGKKR